MFLAALALLMPRVGLAQATAYYTLHSFTGNPDGAQPKGAVVIGKDGALYGTTYTGGTSESGTVFRLTPATGELWTETVIHNFSGPDGLYPDAALIFGTEALYGTTRGGGTGAGTVFELAPPSTAGGNWTETVLYAFDYGGFSDHSQDVIPNGPLLMAPGGTLFTTTQGFAYGNSAFPSGASVALVPPASPGGTWTEYKLYTFGFTSGYWVFAGVVSEGGSLFGTTFYGGDEYCQCGTVYELTPPATAGTTWTETTIHTFTYTASDGEGPQAALTMGPGGVLYGTTQSGGTGSCEYGNGPGCGTVFRLTPPATPGGTWTESVIYSFTGVRATEPIRLQVL
ncbi:MAG TPA: choice-of-anchor tandem repeat GloVer-containing protein [Bryobacteraceae bacterium]|nr:choice-of-anchor tandem repeat GloVer-containing protein [Bryobacteraceae bacterium]